MGRCVAESLVGSSRGCSPRAASLPGFSGRGAHHCPLPGEAGAAHREKGPARGLKVNGKAKPEPGILSPPPTMLRLPPTHTALQAPPPRSRRLPLRLWLRLSVFSVLLFAVDRIVSP